MCDVSLKNINQEHNGNGYNCIIKNDYYYSNDNPKLDLLFAVLIGTWSEKKDGDIKFIENLTGENYLKWIARIRCYSTHNGSFLDHQSQVWKINDRIKYLEEYLEFAYTDHIELFIKLSIYLFIEFDPKFELQVDKRFAASLYDKELEHSTKLRKSIVETFAYICNNKCVLSNCSSDIKNSLGIKFVKKVLAAQDWRTWASLDPLLPIIAEIEPDTFLDSVEIALKNKENTFCKIFSQENTDPLIGCNYMTGLLWALESLAWSDLYIAQIIVILGELHTFDPGGNWTNRPLNSIVNILSTGLVNTTASFEIKLASLKSLDRDFPDVTWCVVLRLLPKSFSCISSTYKPKWLDLIPNDFDYNSTDYEYNKQVLKISELTIELCFKDIKMRIFDIIENIDEIHPIKKHSVIDLIVSYANQELSFEENYILWLTLDQLIHKHKKYHKSHWSLHHEYIKRLENILDGMLKNNQEMNARKLFDLEDIDLVDYIDEINTFQLEIQKVEAKRISVINELFDNIDDVHNFALKVKYPEAVGKSYSKQSTISDTVKPFLISDNKKSKQFIINYCKQSFIYSPNGWFENFDFNNWSNIEKEELFLSLPFCASVWSEVELQLDVKSQRDYWSNVNVQPYYTDKPNDLYIAMDKLSGVQRSSFSVDCLQNVLYRVGCLDVEKSCSFLMKTYQENTRLPKYSIIEVIKYLQEFDNTESEDLLKVEWMYMPLLNGYNSAKPIKLISKIANDPQFYAELLSLCYYSENEENKIKLTETEIMTARSAIDLLSSWKNLPGTTSDEKIDEEYIKNWFDKVYDLTISNGRSKNALYHIGCCLFYYLEKDYFWESETIINLLESKNYNKIREGFKITLYNSRGVHTPSSKDSLELSSKYNSYYKKASMCGYQRFAKILREISQYYIKDSEYAIQLYQKCK